MTNTSTDADAHTTDGGWTPAGHFAEFWADPSAGGRPERKRPDVQAYWPGGLVVSGIEAYNGQLARLIGALPGLRLDVLEHATSGELTFIRWCATWTGRDGPCRMEGVDRLRVIDGQIKENRIFLDRAEFETLTGTAFPTPDQA